MKHILLAAVIVAAVAGCGETPTDNPTPSTTLGSTSTASAPAFPSPQVTVLPAKEQAYLLKLEAIDPAITSDDLTALAIGYGICDRDGQSRADLIAYAQTMGSSASLRLTVEQAGRVVTAAQSELCS